MAEDEPDELEVPPGAEIEPRHAASDPHHFEFDLDRGIRDQAVQKLESSPLLELKKGVGPPASGIYALYFKERLVYIGKASKGTTKSKRTLRARLSEHVAKIGGRKNINLSDMRCRYLTFASDWWVFAAEFAFRPLPSGMERKWIWQQGSRKGQTGYRSC